MMDDPAAVDASGTDFSFFALLEKTSQFVRFKSLEEVKRVQKRICQLNPDLVERRNIGKSRQGRPIELLSIGTGRQSVLIVSGVHANEPVGSLTCEVLQHLLIEHADLRQSLDATWHFVDPIDPDAAELNAGWIKEDLSLDSYFAHFARPALHHQADYTFSLEAGAYRFSGSPPENAAFRAALDICRPDILCPLHNCEFGGAFYVASRPWPELEDKWRIAADVWGVRLSSIGEPFSDLARHSDGVFAMPNPGELVRLALAKGLAPDTFWTAGDTSADYSARYGTFTFTPEVPLWEASASQPGSPNPWSLSAVIEDLLPELEETFRVMSRWNRLVAEPDPDSLLAQAVAEQLTQQPAQISKLQAYAKQASSVYLDSADTIAYRVELALFAVRGPAMLRRLTPAFPEPYRTTAAAELDALIGRIIARVRRIADLTPVSPAVLARLQAHAILEAVSIRNITCPPAA